MVGRQFSFSPPPNLHFSTSYYEINTEPDLQGMKHYPLGHHQAYRHVIWGPAAIYHRGLLMPEYTRIGTKFEHTEIFHGTPASKFS